MQILLERSQTPGIRHLMAFCRPLWNKEWHNEWHKKPEAAVVPPPENA